MPRHDTDVAYIFGGRTWAEHNALRGLDGKDIRTRPCVCLTQGCKEKWLECWGPKNVPHLRRFSEQKGVGSCGMTVDHANAQAYVAGLLETGKDLRVGRECIKCGRVVVKAINLADDEECRPEAFFLNERKNFADLGILPKGAKRGTRPTTIIEILHSSATLEKNRPNDIPWFELKAEDVNRQAALFATDPLHEFEVKCQREIDCECCVRLQTFCDWNKEHIPNYQKFHKCILCEEPRSAPYKHRSGDRYALGSLCDTHNVTFDKCVHDVKFKLSEAIPAKLFFAAAKVLYHKRVAEAERVAADETKRVAADETKRVAAERAKSFRHISKRKVRKVDKSMQLKRNCTKWMCAPVVAPCVMTAPETALYSALLQLGKITPKQHASGFYEMHYKFESDFNA